MRDRTPRRPVIPGILMMLAGLLQFATGVDLLETSASLTQLVRLPEDVPRSLAYVPVFLGLVTFVMAFHILVEAVAHNRRSEVDLGRPGPSETT